MLRFFTKSSLICVTCLLFTTPYTYAKKQGNDIKPLTIKMATLAPKDSPWHEILKEMAAEWREVSDGRVTLKIYPGGVAGDEGDMIRKIRIGQLHAAAITNAGLSRIATEVNVLTIPMAMNSWDDLDLVRKAMAPRLESLLAERGFIVLNWGDAGWVRFFVPVSQPSVKAVQEHAKLMVWAGNDKTSEIWKAAGFRVVPLAATDVLTGLQTGMVNAFNTTPIMALAGQWFPFVEAMIDMPWAPLIGATVISQKMWQKIPDSMQSDLKQIAEKTGDRLQEEVRRMEEQAVAELRKRGLKIIVPTEEQYRQWRQLIETVHPMIRGAVVPADWFDEALMIVASGKTANGR